VPRQKGSEERKLVATRVPMDVWRVIRLAMVLGKENSEQEFLRPVIKEFAERLLREEPELQAMLRAAKEHEARKASETDEGSPLPDREPGTRS
jgi:hypothetical protein